MSVQVGVGLRPKHYSHLLQKPQTTVQWFEVITENFMDSQGRPLKTLETFRKDFPIALHGVSLSIGSAEKLNEEYLKRWKALIDRIEPMVVSDHLCWTGLGGHNTHDLLPMPFTRNSLEVLLPKIHQVQDFLQRPLLLENVSSYVSFKNSEYSEWDFLIEMAKHSGCKLLLDLNNVYVNAKNHGFDAVTFINEIPRELVGQMHLAGFTDMKDYLFDTHSAPVFDEVWKLYRKFLQRFPEDETPPPVLIEWDEDLPEFSVLEAEAIKALDISREVRDA